jgi:hypothetical protein
MTDQGVDQRGLAGAGGASDHRQQRGLERHLARDDVVLELVDDLVPRRALLVGLGQVERELDGLQCAAQLDQRGQHPVALGRGGAHRTGTTCPGKAMCGRTALIRVTNS